MKMADVVSVRSIPAEDKHPELNQSARRQHIEALLRRYPDVRDSETAEIVHFLGTGPHYDVGLLAGSDELGPKVRQVRQDHARSFRPKFHQTILFLAAVAGPAAALAAKYLLG